LFAALLTPRQTFGRGRIVAQKILKNIFYHIDRLCHCGEPPAPLQQRPAMSFLRPFSSCSPDRSPFMTAMDTAYASILILL
jgi:hypothetical protein